MDNKPRTNALETGDTVTMDGVFKRRTFWQWLRNEPKVLQEFVVTKTYETPNETT